MFELKVDPIFPNHYIIGVAMRDIHSKDRGKLYVKYGPLYFTNEDVKNLSNALLLLEDRIYREIYKLNPRDIYKITNCDEIIMSMIGLKLAAKSNNATLHHFSSESLLSEPQKFFDEYVKRANIPGSEEMKGLNESKVRGW